MKDFNPLWFIAGGWSIDLFLGKITRPHDDIEIAVFRQNQLELQRYLHDWTLKKAENGELLNWNNNEFLELPVHEIHCFHEKSDSPFLEILLNEKSGNNWVFRRNKQITKPLSEVFLTSDSGIKFLCPEVVLLYKSKNPRTKDEQDFQAVAGNLDTKGKSWLKNALEMCYSEHHWLKSL